MFIIGFVNYKSSLYMETQFKIYEKFAGEPFKIIVVDNSMNQYEMEVLQRMVVQHNIPIQLIERDASGEYSSLAHGNGLQYIYELILQQHPSAEYFITQDPDFFWVQPGFLKYLRGLMDRHVVVGAPYHCKEVAEWSGHPWFPTASGSVHNLTVLREIGADFRYSPEPAPKGKIRDVGWQIREKLANRPYYSFKQECFIPLRPFTFEENDISRKYVTEEGKTIAYHLHRGSFEVAATKGLRMVKGRVKYRQRLRECMPPKEWQENRKKMCEVFWNEISKRSEE